MSPLAVPTLSTHRVPGAKYVLMMFCNVYNHYNKEYDTSQVTNFRNSYKFIKKIKKFKIMNMIMILYNVIRNVKKYKLCK